MSSRWTNHGSIEEEKRWASVEQKCSRCGLTAGDMVGTPPRCAMQARCDRMLKHEPLGGPPVNVTTPMACYDLTPEEERELDQAAADRQAKRDREAAS